MKKKALITGGAGFIGINLAEKLLKKGWKLSIFDNLSREGSNKNLDWLQNNYKLPKLKVYIKDIRDEGALREAVKGVDVIFHLAAQTALTTSIKNPREDFGVNAQGTLNVLEVARVSRKKPLVLYSSTNKVYGGMEDIKFIEGKARYSYKDFPEGIAEDFPLDFHSPYGCSKGAADQYTRDYYRVFGLPTVVFRQSCIYGPHQMGIEDQGWLAHFVISAIFGRPITIYGDGKQVRDVLYIDDLIDAFLKAVYKINKAAGQVYNIGGGNENSLSLCEFINLLEKKLGVKMRTKYADWRQGDQKVFISDNRKLKKDLNWRPKTLYEKGVERLIDWIGENRKLFN